MRAFIALSGLKPVGEKLAGPRRDRARATRSARSACWPTTSAAGSSARCARTRSRKAHDELVRPRRRGRRPGQASCARSSEKLLREHGKGIIERQFQQKRLADAIADIYAQVAVLSRVTAIFEDQGVEPSGQERYIAETLLHARGRPRRAPLRPDRVERRRAHDGDRQARLQARLVRLRAVRGLDQSLGHDRLGLVGGVVLEDARIGGSNHLRRKNAGKNGHDDEHQDDAERAGRRCR